MIGTGMTDPNRTQALNADPNRTLMGTAPSLNATVTIQPVQCPVCKTFNPAGVMFCIECGLIFDRALPDDAFGAPAVQLPMLVDSTGKEHPLRPGTTTIGREGDIMLVDGRVSRRHAQIVNDSGALRIEELGSTNGTLVNGVKVEPGSPKTLAGGETLSFGGVEARVALPGGEAGKTQAIPSNRTAAISAPPTVSQVVAKLVSPEATFPLKAGSNTFGRKSDNDVVISDPFISGRHGVIEVEEAEAYITDTGSTNGTLVNEAKLSPNLRTRLGPEDVIRLGSVEYRLERN